MIWNGKYYSILNFNVWFDALEEDIKDAFIAALGLLKRIGPGLSRPYSDTLHGTQVKNLKELRLKFENEPWRILYTFDPKRKAILLVGGNKAGDRNWYKRNIPIAEERFFRHLAKLEMGDV